MKIMGLDMSSTKTGVAVIEDGILIYQGLVKVEPISVDGLAEDFSFVQRSRIMARDIMIIIDEIEPDKIFIEQTNAGKNRTSQKQVEFTHCALLSAFDLTQAGKVSYVDTSRWRSVLKVRLDKDQRVHNKKVKDKLAKGKVTSKHLAVSWVNARYGKSLKLKDHDVADSICIAAYGWLSKDIVMTKFDIDSILKS